MTIHLPESLERPILAAVHGGRYASLDDAMTEAASLLVQRLRQEQAQAQPAASQSQAVPTDKPIWEVIEDENRSIPPEVWDSLPADLSEQHDHYIYGTPKRLAQ
jgi:Arc/MetJ-type ribon-helix-helix transcriptional regulator